MLHTSRRIMKILSKQRDRRSRCASALLWELQIASFISCSFIIFLAFNAQSEAEFTRLRNAVRDEQIRVWNSVRAYERVCACRVMCPMCVISDVSDVSAVAHCVCSLLRRTTVAADSPGPVRSLQRLYM